MFYEFLAGASPEVLGLSPLPSPPIPSHPWEHLPTLAPPVPAREEATPLLPNPPPPPPVPTLPPPSSPSQEKQRYGGLKDATHYKCLNQGQCFQRRVRPRVRRCGQRTGEGVKGGVTGRSCWGLQRLTKASVSVPPVAILAWVLTVRRPGTQAAETRAAPLACFPMGQGGPIRCRISGWREG